MKIGREAAKQMFRDDKNSQGCYRSVMTKIDKIYDSLDEALNQGQILPIGSVSKCLHPKDKQEVLISCKDCKQTIGNKDIFF